MNIEKRWLVDKLVAMGWTFVPYTRELRRARERLHWRDVEFTEADVEAHLLWPIDEVNGCADDYYNRSREMFRLRRPEGVSQKQESFIVSHLMHGHEIVRVDVNTFVPVSRALLDWANASASDVVGALTRETA